MAFGSCQVSLWTRRAGPTSGHRLYDVSRRYSRSASRRRRTEHRSLSRSLRQLFHEVGAPLEGVHARPARGLEREQQRAAVRGRCVR